MESLQVWEVKLGAFRVLKSLKGKGETAKEKLSEPDTMIHAYNLVTSETEARGLSQV